ncbi:MAG: hypothetical protein AB1765_11125 [Candidatus Hydrogenedentota bacterium]
MNSISRKYFLLFLILLIPSISTARTRQQVIDDATVYSNYLWIPFKDNLLDNETCISGIGKIIIPDGDEIDDRRQVYNSTTTLCSEDPSLWPFVANFSVTGEAYAWGYGHHLTPAMKNPQSTYVYKSFQEYLAEGRIAGARKGEKDRKGNAIGDLGNNADFTGLDCSGFITRVWGMKGYHFGTGLLPDYTRALDIVEKLESGDILNKIGVHTILFDHWITTYTKASVIHAATWDLLGSTHVRRVINDEIKFEEKEGRIYAYMKTSDTKESPYDNWHIFDYLSAFPQVEWVSPAPLPPGTQTELSTEPVKEIKFTLRSKTSISTSTIKLVIDEGLTSSRTITSQDLTISDRINNEAFPENTGLTIRCDILDSKFNVKVGTHTVTAYAKNILNLEDSDKAGFSVPIDTTPPTIIWSDWKRPIGQIMTDCVTQPCYPNNVTGVVVGSNNIEDAPWLQLTGSEITTSYFLIEDSTNVWYFQTSSEPFSAEFRFEDSGTGTESFAIYFPNKTEPEIEGSITDGEKLILTNMMLKEDGTGYMLTASDKFLNTTTMYFHLDRQSPRLTISSITINKISSDFTATFNSVATDNMSGLSDDAGLCLLGSCDFKYKGPTWPLGPQTTIYIITLVPEPIIKDYYFYAFDRSGLLNVYDIRSIYGKYETSLSCIGLSGPFDIVGMLKNICRPQEFQDFEAFYILDRININVGEPDAPGGCNFIEGYKPTGMHTKVKLESYSPTMDELKSYNAWVSSLPVPIIRDYETISLPASWDVQLGSNTISVDKALPLWGVVPYTERYGNTNNDVRAQCTNPDGSTYIATWGANTFVYKHLLSYDIKRFVVSISSRPAEILLAPGFNVKVAMENIEIIFSSITIGGQLFVSRSKFYPEIQGYKAYEDGSFDIITTAQAENITIRVRLSPDTFTEKQISTARMYHYDATTQTWTDITKMCAPNCAQSSIPRTTGSPFVVMVPIDDITPPETTPMFYGEAFGPYISTETYIGLSAEDTAVQGDALGVAKINYILDPQVDELTCRAV